MGDTTAKRAFCNLYMDDELGIEAYVYNGNAKCIPNHFHRYYEIGFIEIGNRLITCQSVQYKAASGDIVIFNPADNHSCQAQADEYLDYRCIHIPTSLLCNILDIYCDTNTYLHFSSPVIYGNKALLTLLKDLHQMILDGRCGIEKEEQLVLFLHELVNRSYPERSVPKTATAISDAIETVCNFIQTQFLSDISLEMMCEISGFSKYYFIRSFTQLKGVSPYCYISALRINHAKELLKTKQPLSDIALQLGYSHQSHFSNAFKRVVGMTPKQYADLYL